MRTRDGKSEEDNVACHVGNEDMAQDQIAERIDETSDQRQRDQERRERPERGGTVRNEGLSYFSEESIHF